MSNSPKGTTRRDVMSIGAKPKGTIHPDELMKAADDAIQNRRFTLDDYLPSFRKMKAAGLSIEEIHQVCVDAGLNYAPGSDE